MRTLARVLLTLAAVVIVGYFIAAMGGQVGPVRAFDEPAVPGKFGYQFVVAFALIIGWAVGAGLEDMWRKPDGDRTEEPWWPLATGIAARLLAGIVLFFLIVGVDFGFEALGVGLGR